MSSSESSEKLLSVDDVISLVNVIGQFSHDTIGSFDPFHALYAYNANMLCWYTILTEYATWTVKMYYRLFHIYHSHNISISTARR